MTARLYRIDALRTLAQRLDAAARQMTAAREHVIDARISRECAVAANKIAIEVREAVGALPDALRGRAGAIVDRAVCIQRDSHNLFVALDGPSAPVLYLCPRRREYDRATVLLDAAETEADAADAGDVVAAIRAKLTADRALEILAKIHSFREPPRDDLDRLIYRDHGLAWSIIHRVRPVLRGARRRRPVLRVARLLPAIVANAA